MPVASLDHLVLTVRDPEATRRFYVDGLGMRWTTFGEGRLALGFGGQKINLHVAGREIEPKATVALPGTGDLCFLLDDEEPLEEAAARLEGLGFPVVMGPSDQTGAAGPIRSFYFRDPDGNLVEISRPR